MDLSLEVNMLNQLIWRPMESAPNDPKEHFWLLTNHGNIELVTCLPELGKDRYGVGNCSYQGVAWTPLVKPALPPRDQGTWLVDQDPSFKR